jgi:hypothetical protein
MLEVKSNQYIPYRAKKSPSGFPLATTYWYVVNEQGKTINKHTGKTYRGKQMDNYAFHSEDNAKEFVNKFAS